MTAVDRLAAVIEATLNAMPADARPTALVNRDRAARIAAVIASSDDLAVIERPVVRWGIRKVGDADSLFSVSGWTQADAEKACSYNSERRGRHEVVRWVQSAPEAVSDRG